MPNSDSPYARLREFLDQKMRMSHLYQPVMLEVLLTRGGTATIREIAAAILAHDESQLDYYEQIVKNMPGRVLRSHGIVERPGTSYALSADATELTQEEREDLISRCRAAVEAFKTKRGEAIWQHRAVTSGLIPGRVRYETVKRAAFRCELCGVSAEERALDVDHIVPRSVGGSDDAENLQALCWLCNTNKGSGDDADFRGIIEGYRLREAGCPFCVVEENRMVAQNPLAFLIRDSFPVTEGHLPRGPSPPRLGLLRPAST